MALQTLEHALGLDAQNELRLALELQVLDPRRHRVGARAKAGAIDGDLFPRLFVSIDDRQLASIERGIPIIVEKPIADTEAPVLTGRDGMMTLASTLAISAAARIAFTRTGGCDAEQMIQTR